MPIADDAVNSTVVLTEKLLDIILKLLDRQKRSHDFNGDKVKVPKVKTGKLSKREYNRLLKSGEKFHLVTIPAEKIDKINEIAKQLGGSYAIIENNGKRADLAVPESGMTQLQQAIEAALKEQLTQEPDSLGVKNGKELVSAEDKEIVRSVLEISGVPVYSFDNKDGSCMNIVPAEFDGEYENAMKTVRAVKAEMENIEVIDFEQTAELDDLIKDDTVIMELTEEQAEYLSENMSDVKLCHDENGKIYGKIAGSLSGQAEKLMNQFSEEMTAFENNLITIVDNTVTISKDKLMISENEAEYFTKVPNTAGQDYIKLPKSETALTDGGKTISAKIDLNARYRIYDKDGSLKGEKSGRELAAMYNTQSRNVGKDTEVSHYHNDSIERVELYDSKQNKLISLGIESADIIRRDLAEQGIRGAAAEKLLREINKKLPENLRERFAYEPVRKELRFEDISQSVLNQYKAAELIRAAKAQDIGSDKETGAKCLIYDKAKKQYAVIEPDTKRINKALSDMGFDVLHSHVITAQIAKSYDKTGARLERENVEVQSFDTLNPELTPLRYGETENGMVIAKTETDNREMKLQYVEIEKGTSRADVEKALRELGIRDDRSMIEMMDHLEKINVIPSAGQSLSRNGIGISRVTSKCAILTKNSKTMTVNKNNIDEKAIAAVFGMSVKEAERLSKSIEKAFTAADRSGKGNIKGIGQLVKSAKERSQKLSEEKKAPDKTLSVPRNR